MAAPRMAPPTIAPKIAAPSPLLAEAGLGVKAKAVAAARVRAVILVFMIVSSRVEVVFQPVGRSSSAVYSFSLQEKMSPRKWLKISLLIAGRRLVCGHDRGRPLQEFQGPARHGGQACALQPRARAQRQRQDEPHPGLAAPAHARRSAGEPRAGPGGGSGQRTADRI